MPMRVQKVIISFFIGHLILWPPDIVSAQDNHYWINQYGPTSTLLGGAVTGGVRDNSLIFYNPGAAAFTSNFNLSIQSDVVYYENLHIKNGAGTGIDLNHEGFTGTPQLLAFTYGNKKTAAAENLLRFAECDQ